MVEEDSLQTPIKYYTIDLPIHILSEISIEYDEKIGNIIDTNRIAIIKEFFDSTQYGTDSPARLNKDQTQTARRNFKALIKRYKVFKTGKVNPEEIRRFVGRWFAIYQEGYPFLIRVSDINLKRVKYVSFSMDEEEQNCFKVDMTPEGPRYLCDSFMWLSSFLWCVKRQEVPQDQIADFVYSI